MDPVAPELNPAIMARMVLKSRDQKLGRTQLMKLCYFLQEIESVPLSYDFRIFNYGPYDSEVLYYLGTACGNDVLNEETVIYPRSYGYKITPGPKAQELSDSLDPELAERIDRITQSFSGDGAGELELKSTIVFVDREFDRKQQPGNIDIIADRVHSIKPHFPLQKVKESVESMRPYLNSLGF